MPTKDSFTLKDVFRRERLTSLLTALTLLAAAYVVEHFANTYAFEYSLRSTSNHVGDLILDNLPVVNLNFIIIEGALTAIIFGTLFVVFLRPRYLLFTLKAIALFIMVRALFISLTHVGIYPDHIVPGYGLFDGIYQYLNFETGLFFSGHTGLPFLMALIFWQTPLARYFFLALSCIGGVAVLLAHIHYSIDVFAAPFMTYSIFRIALYLFPHDHALIEPVADTALTALEEKQKRLD
ncbi:MAG: phosphatase PAP2-related protein [Candidatus Kaiserbacteria bacterium]|nr:phosphatase PAP2-related protein [Candidatus Kaiserbacteria bacterium]